MQIVQIICVLTKLTIDTIVKPVIIVVYVK